MIRAYYLYTGDDGNSHVQRGSIAEGALVGAESIHFKETPPHSSFDWHNDPTPHMSLRWQAYWNLPPSAARPLRSIREILCWRWITPVLAISGS